RLPRPLLAIQEDVPEPRAPAAHRGHRLPPEAGALPGGRLRRERGDQGAFLRRGAPLEALETAADRGQVLLASGGEFPQIPEDLGGLLARRAVGPEDLYE